MNIDSIKDRIRKLLNTAKDDAATEGEISNAIRFAKSIMDKHHLSEDDLATEPATQYSAIDEAAKGRLYATVGPKLYCWEGKLAMFVSKFCAVGVYRDSEKRCAKNGSGFVRLDDQGWPSEGKSYCFYGVAEDAAMAVDLYYELWATIRSMALLKFGKCYMGDGGMYCEGFTAGLAAKLKNEEEQQKITSTNSGDSRALVLIERRNDLVEYKINAAKQYLSNDVGIKLRNTSRSSGANGSASAYHEGRSDGERSNVNRPTRAPKIC